MESLGSGYSLLQCYVLDNGGATAFLFEDDWCSSSEPKNEEHSDTN